MPDDENDNNGADDPGDLEGRTYDTSELDCMSFGCGSSYMRRSAVERVQAAVQARADLESERAIPDYKVN